MIKNHTKYLMNNIYDIWLSRIDISNKLKLKILNEVNAEFLWNLNKKELEGIENNNIKEKDIQKILDKKYKTDLEKYCEYMEKNCIKIINFNSDKYPEKLNNIENKPAYIYIRGNENILNDDSIAIVGSRNASEYGKIVARKLGKEICNRNVNVISGLAIGIDKYAHLGSLDSKIGKTIAVLANGLADNDIYPYQNKKVFERILENGGTAISEYIIGTKPVIYNFPTRNRIISGLANKVIVVEAKEKSGSLITVEYALEQGKDVFAIPGNITSINSKGTNKLIKEGAFLLENINDLFF